MNKLRNKIFIVLCLLIFIAGDLTLIRSPKAVSYIENRDLAQFQHFTINTFLNSQYQTSFTNALQDQFTFSRIIKNNFNKFTKIVDYSHLNKKVCKNKYVLINDEYAVYDCSDRIVYTPATHSDIVEQKTKKRIDGIKKEVLDNAELYFYFIDTSTVFNFEKKSKSI